MKLQIRKIGNHYAVLLPKGLLKSLNVRAGDELYVSEEDGSITLSPYNSGFDNVMAAYDKFSRCYCNALKELAK